ncbi:acetyl-CoA carboxylase biotin carboxyl carrier protein [Paenibacillus sp. FSL F4-0087]|uniref:Biotin carboxyl carrier protein of acetyl-CoA carboxylase n=1 Tax=Paenibacillus taichungensis TaxID=484184 RepID=A0ABX2MSM8_9BACL|nr:MULTISPECIES: acetyl-CoA carboxylase biotin carboxyl carrier protein [Paenibacillus]MDR9746907.1 acetyl-CoA carboxylase biotin carboxyl carrier protein [Paenibacillus taichungensis]NUU57104.1 acetyl-CoA carboxylase biotin carboxyl carrier protein [Paenibacillus taichungensis]OME77104.1 acetyl-CoA carboxylase, biotin carboxyl carrier protein [Paenibacillus pabuli]PIH57438.1 acetyl-CoA carboxylase, biotin carboxyl carrier protein [Paenibacillus sp. LK1]
MFKLSEIKELIKLVDESSVQELEIENEGSRLSIRKPGKTEYVQATAIQPQMIAAPQVQPAAVVAEAAPQVDTTSHLHKIVSPMVGTFYRASSPEAGPFVSAGDKVVEKTTVCIIEAMKLMNELDADIKGEIVEVLVENGQLVEYGQPLFLVKPE